MQKKGGAGILRNATSVMLCCVQRLCVGTDLGTPLIKSMLDAVDDVGQDHPGDREDQDTDKHFIGLKSCTCDSNHETDTRSCRIELADHDANQRAAYGSPKSRQNTRH